ncbi:putative peroxygenase 3 [Bienertia sinuspersici]
MARALVAPDLDNVNGTPNHRHNNMSVLQQHVAFFDLNGDGIIYPSETFKGTLQHFIGSHTYIIKLRLTGFRRLGLNPVACFFTMVLIHLTMSYATSPVSRIFLLFLLLVFGYHIYVGAK